MARARETGYAEGRDPAAGEEARGQEGQQRGGAGEALDLRLPALILREP